MRARVSTMMIVSMPVTDQNELEEALNRLMVAIVGSHPVTDATGNPLGTVTIEGGGTVEIEEGGLPE